MFFSSGLQIKDHMVQQNDKTYHINLSKLQKSITIIRMNHKDVIQRKRSHGGWSTK